MFKIFKRKFREEDTLDLNFLTTEILTILEKLVNHNQNNSQDKKSLIKHLKTKIVLFFNLIEANHILQQVSKDLKEKRITKTSNDYTLFQNFFVYVDKIKKNFKESNFNEMVTIFKSIQQLNIFDILKNYVIENLVENTFMYQIIEEEFKCGIVQNEIVKNSAINELKMIILLIVNDVKNQMRSEFISEFDYTIIKNSDYFKKHEEELIKKVLLIIKEQIEKFVTIKDRGDYDKIHSSFHSNLIIENPNFKVEENEEENFFKEEEDWTKDHLYTLKFGVCRHFSFLYLSIFQMLNFPLTKVSLSLAPQHIFLRYKLNNGTFLNFETMFEDWKTSQEKYEGKTFSQRNKDSFLDDFEYKIGAPGYYEHRKISDELIEKKIYLNFLSHQELVSNYYCNCAYTLSHSNVVQNHKKALEYYEKAISLNPENINCYYNCAFLLA